MGGSGPRRSLLYFPNLLAASQIEFSSCRLALTDDWWGVAGVAWIPRGPAFWSQVAGSATARVLHHSVAWPLGRCPSGLAVLPRCGILLAALPQDGIWTWLHLSCRCLAPVQRLLEVALVVGEREGLLLAASAPAVARHVLGGPQPVVGQWLSRLD